jgi:hypothetical protein
VWAATEIPAFERPAGTDLLFLRVVVLGATDDALLVAPLDAQDNLLAPIRAVPPSASPDLAHVENLRVLGRAPGLKLWVIARVVFTAPRTIFLLTISPALDNGLRSSPSAPLAPLDPLPAAASPDNGLSSSPPAPLDPLPAAASPDAAPAAVEPPELKLPAAWTQRCNMGLDKLDRTMILRHSPTPVYVQDLPTPPVPDVLEPLRRRLQRLVYGGRITARGPVLDDMRREAARLRQLMMPQGAELLERLASAAVEAERTLTGERLYRDHESLSRAWMAGTSYLAAAQRGLERISWTGE